MGAGLGLGAMAVSYMAGPAKSFLIQHGLISHVLDYCPLWLASLLHGSDLSGLVEGSDGASGEQPKREGRQADAASIEELSAVPAPRHIAAIMDGNRRYGKVGMAGAGERWIVQLL